MRWAICWPSKGQTLDAVIELQVDDAALVGHRGAIVRQLRGRLP
jgi:hypothetical protein